MRGRRARSGWQARERRGGVVSARIYDLDPHAPFAIMAPERLRLFDRALILDVMGAPSSDDDGLPKIVGAGMLLSWFAHQTDDVGAACRAELARRERLDAEAL